VVYSYLPSDAPSGTRDTHWLAVMAPALMERRELDGVEEARWIIGADGLEFADLGVICPEDVGLPYVPTLNGSVVDTCQRRAIGIGPGVVVEMGLAPDVDLEALIARLRIGTLEELMAAVGPVDGTDSISATSPVFPEEEPTPPPDTPFCNAWLVVLEEARANGESGSLWSPALAAAQEEAARTAPTAELAADIRYLSEDWADGTPTDESAAVMQRVVNAASAACPGIQEWVEKQ
jgi:hypothetical protein